VYEGGDQRHDGLAILPLSYAPNQAAVSHQLQAGIDPSAVDIQRRLGCSNPNLIGFHQYGTSH
jgi:hypothetical protein